MDNLNSLWKEVLNDLENQLSSISFDMWVKKLIPVDVIENNLYIKAPNKMTKQVCNDNFQFLIQQSICNIFKVNDYTILNPDEYQEFNKMCQNINIDNDNKRVNPFNRKYTFENFVVGKSNEFVYSAAKTVAENPGTRFNPLFIYGGVGLGKTHLLQSIGNYIFEHMPDKKTMYATCENFTNDYLKCLHNKNNDISEFREKYRNVDILLIDDIQAISNKEATQEEFFNTFNDLYQNDKQIILTSDRPPNEIATLTSRMVSRFSMGLIQDIQTPDFETKYVILKKKTQLENTLIDDDALSYIAENVTSNIRDLEGVLTKTIFLANLRGKTNATIDEARETLQTKLDEAKENLSPSLIINYVCKYYNVEKQLIRLDHFSWK